MSRRLFHISVIIALLVFMGFFIFSPHIHAPSTDSHAPQVTAQKLTLKSKLQILTETSNGTTVVDTHIPTKVSTTTTATAVTATTTTKNLRILSQGELCESGKHEFHSCSRKLTVLVVLQGTMYPTMQVSIIFTLICPGRSNILFCTFERDVTRGCTISLRR